MKDFIISLNVSQNREEQLREETKTLLIESVNSLNINKNDAKTSKVMLERASINIAREERDPEYDELKECALKVKELKASIVDKYGKDAVDRLNEIF